MRKAGCFRIHSQTVKMPLRAGVYAPLSAAFCFVHKPATLLAGKYAILKTTKQNNTQPTIFHLSFILVPFPAIIRSNFYKDTGKFLKTSPPASKQKTCVKKKFLTQAGFIQPNRFLIVIGEQFKISFRMQAGRTNFGRSFADMYITAFTAIPADFFRAGKDQIIPYIL